jgi:sigma-70-like protein
MALVLRMSEANAKLPGPEREVLALLSESAFGYAEIGELLGVETRTVAEIAARARLRLARETLPELAEPCARELPYLAARIDGEALASSNPQHGSRCLVCRGNLDAMRIADAAYRAWVPAQMPDQLRAGTRAQIQDSDGRSLR